MRCCQCCPSSTWGQHLTALLLDALITWGTWPDDFPGLPVCNADFSTVSACSSLQHLQLHMDVLWYVPDDIEQFWLEVFPAGHMLPQLHWLSLGQGTSHVSTTGRVLARLAQSRPALQHLSFQPYWDADLVLQPLRCLSGLTSLDMNSSMFGGSHVHSKLRELADQMAQLTALHSLKLSDARISSAYQLWPLTALSQLTHFSCTQLQAASCHGLCITQWAMLGWRLCHSSEPIQGAF